MQENPQQILKELGLNRKDIVLFNPRPGDIDQLRRANPLMAELVIATSDISDGLARLTKGETLLAGGLGFVAAVHKGIPYRIHGDADFLVPLKYRGAVLAAYQAQLSQGGFFADLELPTKNGKKLKIQFIFLAETADGRGMKHPFIDEEWDREVFRPQHLDILGYPVDAVSPELAWFLARNHQGQNLKGRFDERYTRVLVPDVDIRYGRD